MGTQVPNPVSPDLDSHRAIWRIAGPMILSAITTPLLGMVDTAVVGHLEQPWYSAPSRLARRYLPSCRGPNFRHGYHRPDRAGLRRGFNDGVRTIVQPALVALLAVLIILLQAPILEIA